MKCPAMLDELRSTVILHGRHLGTMHHALRPACGSRNKDFALGCRTRRNEKYERGESADDKCCGAKHGGLAPETDLSHPTSRRRKSRAQARAGAAAGALTRRPGRR